MKIKKFLVGLFAVLMMIPVYSYAVPNITGYGSFDSSDDYRYYVPITVNDQRLNNISFNAYSGQRNQIGEMMMVEPDGDRYRVSLKIGTYSLLNFVQIVKPENAAQSLEIGLTNLALGTFNIPDDADISFLSENYPNYSPVDSMNDYYLSEEDVTIEPYEEEKDTALISFYVDDLEIPIIIRSFSDKEAEYTAYNGLNDQVIEVGTAEMFQFPEISETTSLKRLWMGWYIGGNGALAGRVGKKTDGTTFFDKAFADQIQVEPQGDGTYLAALSIMEESLSDDDKIDKIEIAVSRPPEEGDGTIAELPENYLNDYWAVYEPLDIKDGKILIPYDSLEQMAMGNTFRITTVSDQKKNMGKGEIDQSYHFASLYIVEEKQINEQKTITDEATGVSFRYWTNDYPEGSTFSVEVGNRDFLESLLASYIGYAKDSRVYHFTVRNENGEIKNPESPVEIIIPIPEDWEPDHMYQILHDGTNIWPTRPGERLDRENRTITLSSTTAIYYNGSYIMYDAGTAEDLTTLTDGIYQVKVTIASKTDPLQTSMANEAFATIPAYLEVNNGEIELYAETGGVNFSGQYGYISNMFMGDIDSEDKEEVTYLDYQTEDGKPIWLTDGETYSAFNIKRIKTKLTDPIESGNYQYAYQVGFWVPIMDGMTGGNPGSGTGAQPAFLRVSDIVPVDENPLNGYENTVAMVAADKARYYLQTADGLSEEKKGYIENAISRAEAEIESWGDAAAEEERIFAVCDALETAMDSEPLRSGRYQIPFADGSDLSELKDAYVVVRDGNMTVSLEMADGTSMPEVEYRGEYGDFLTDAEVSGDGGKVTFVLPYTESDLTLRIGGTERVFALDFAGATLVSTDLSAMEALLTEAKARLETENVYTSGTLETLRAEVEKAETLLEDFDVEQTAVDAQKELVQAALDSLKELADLTELRNVLLNASKKAADKTYTEDSRGSLLDLITAVKGYIREEADVSVEDAADYVKQLSEMMDALDTEPDDDDDTDDVADGTLESFVSDYRSWYSQEDFTEKSWSEFESALVAAEDLGSGLSEAENQKAIENLMEARNSLIRRTEGSEELEKLQQALEEIRDAVETNGSAGYIGYDTLTASADAAETAARGDCYLSGSQAALLQVSMEKQYAAMLEEDNVSAESAVFLLNYLDYIPSVDLEELEETEEVLEETSETETEESAKETTEENSEEGTQENAEETAEESSEGAAQESAKETAEESSEGATQESAKETAEESSEGATQESANEATEESSEAAEESTENAAEEYTEANAENEGNTGSENRKEQEAKEESETGKTGTAERESEDRTEREPEDGSGADGTEEGGAKTQSEDGEEERSESEETKELTLSISRHYAPFVTAAINSGEYADGTYYVDYDLYQWEDEKLSMGNPALDYGTEPGRIILDDGVWTLYIRFNQMEYTGIVGELKSMQRMINISNGKDGLDYDLKKADYPAVIEEFPKVLGFTADPDDEYIPVLVYVPVMTSGPEQPARLKVDWDSLEYINGSVDINSSMDLSKLETAVKAAEKLKKTDYTSWSWKVVEENLKAAEDIKAYVEATQSMIDARAEALEAAVAALVKTAANGDYAKLSDALLEAYIADETEYSRNAWMELERARTAAENLQDASDVTPGMIDMAVQDLEEAVARTGGRTPDGGQDDDDTAGLRYSTLSSLIGLLEDYSSGDYTETSWKLFESALKSAKKVLEAAKKGETTQSEIDDQVELLKDARSGLVSSTPVKTAVNLKYLKALMSRAEEFLKRSSEYTDVSVRRLQTEYDLAAAMAEDEDATQDDVDEQKEALRTAINSLAASTDDSGSGGDSGNGSGDSGSDSDDSGSDEDDGYYKVNVRLWHATLNKASMGDPALVRTAYVHIDDGDITMRLQTKKMTTSGITTHLYEFYIYEDGDYEEAELVSTENSRWIYEFQLPNDNNTYYKCKVDPRVDVMGDDPVKARLKVDWKSLKEVDEDDWDDLEGDTDDDDDDDSSSSGSGASTMELSSGETGIKVKGNTGGPGIVLEASRKENGSSEHTMTAAALEGVANQFVLYDIKLRSGNSYVQPGGSLTLSVPIPAGYDTGRLVMYRINDDGTKSELTGRVNGSYYEATVDHFSLYALVESNQVKTAAVSAAGSTGDSSSGSSRSTRTSRTGGSSGTGSAGSSAAGTGEADEAAGTHMVDGREIPYTGDPMPVKELAGVGMIAVLILAGTMVPKRRGREEEMAADQRERG